MAKRVTDTESANLLKAFFERYNCCVKVTDLDLEAVRSHGPEDVWTWRTVNLSVLNDMQTS